LLDRVRATGRPMMQGLGPRYLHSTGQLHKGGPDTGLFIQVVDNLGDELPIPGQPYGFRQLIAAQAEGDFEALRERGRRLDGVRREDVAGGWGWLVAAAGAATWRSGGGSTGTRCRRTLAPGAAPRRR